VRSLGIARDEICSGESKGLPRQQPVGEHDLTTQANQLQLQEGSRKAYETIREVLVAQGHNIALTCGLRQVTCSRTGRTAWVLDNDATEQAWRDNISA
jgi:hypothetical protein